MWHAADGFADVGAVRHGERRAPDTHSATQPIGCGRSDGEDGFVNRYLKRAAAPIQESAMLHYAVVFFVIALIAALFGFGGIAAGAAGIAKILFVVFIILAIATFLFGRNRGA